MNDNLTKTCKELRAELSALHKKLEALEAKYSGSNVGASFTTHRIFSRHRVAALLSVALLLAAGGLLYGQGAGDALFINPQGWVGIGTNAPKATLDVAGKLNVSDNSTLSNTTVAGSLTTTGNIGVGTATPGVRLEVAGNTRFNGVVAINRAAIQDQHLVINPDNGKIPFNVTDPANSKNWLSVFANGDVIMNGGNVGIGTTIPGAKLDVAGAVKATSINGEKLPLVFDVGQKSDTQRWHYVNQDIGPLCGDADGCTMKFFLRENSTDRVRTILEQIYIEQPDKSSNKTPGLYGHARQLGGGDSEFILQTANKYEIVPHPFDWIYVRNYQSPEVGAQSPAFGGYAVQFMTKPNVSATVIIYDR